MESGVCVIDIEKFAESEIRKVSFHVHDDDWYEFAKSEEFLKLQDYILYLESKRNRNFLQCHQQAVPSQQNGNE